MIQTFSTNGETYSVDTLQGWCNSYGQYVKIDLSEVVHVLDHDSWMDGRGDTLKPMEVINNPTTYKDHYDRITGANLTYSIMVSEKPSKRNNKRFVIDGIHRVAKAYIDGQSKMWATYVPSSIMDCATISSYGSNVTAYSMVDDPVSHFRNRFNARAEAQNLPYSVTQSARVTPPMVHRIIKIDQSFF
jgi:hypothetical protein